MFHCFHSQADYRSLTLLTWFPLIMWLLFSMNLAEICDNAKKGREYALLGNYDSSIVYYQGVIQQISKHCQTLRDPALKVKWQQVSFDHTIVAPGIKPLLQGSLFCGCSSALQIFEVFSQYGQRVNIWEHASTDFLCKTVFCNGAMLPLGNMLIFGLLWWLIVINNTSQLQCSTSEKRQEPKEPVVFYFVKRLSGSHAESLFCSHTDQISDFSKQKWSENVSWSLLVWKKICFTIIHK